MGYRKALAIALAVMLTAAFVPFASASAGSTVNAAPAKVVLVKAGAHARPHHRRHHHRRHRHHHRKVVGHAK